MKDAGFDAFTPIDWTYYSEDGQWITLNPDGPGADSGAYDSTHSYFADGWTVSSDPSTWIRGPGHGVQDVSLETLSIFYGVLGIVKAGGKAVGAALTRQVVIEGTEVIANGVTRQMIQTAAADTGPVVNVVSKLAQSPQVGRSLYVWEDGTVAVANQAIKEGAVFTAKIPKALVETLRSAGLVESQATLMNGVTQTALKFDAKASEFISTFLQID